MKDIDIDDIKKLEAIEYDKIIIGGAALLLYGVERGTSDIDFNVDVPSFEALEGVQSKLVELGIKADVSSNIEGWGIVPLPTGFRDRLLDTEIERTKVLHPLDFVFAKLRRGTEQDIKDCIKVYEVSGLTSDEVSDHMGLVQLPLDPASLDFKKKVAFFVNALCDLEDNPSICGDLGA